MKKYIFEFEHGKLETITVNMDEIREVGRTWEKENPIPPPPTKRPEYYRENSKEMLAIKKELGISRVQAIDEWRNRQELVPDEDDETYKIDLLLWQQRKLGVQATEMMSKAVLVNGKCIRDAVRDGDDLSVLAILRSNPKSYRDLYYHILETSELTETAVMKAVDAMDYTWHKRPILDWVNDGVIPKGNAGSSWLAMGMMAAKEVSGMPPHEFRALEISQQAEIVAIYLVESWIKALRAEEERVKRDQERQKRESKRNRTPY